MINPKMIKLTKKISECPLCQSKLHKQFHKIAFQNEFLNYWQCQRCGIIFQSPQMYEEEKQDYYAYEYRLHMFRQAEPPKIDLEIQTKRANHIVSLAQTQIKDLQGRTHLDIGSGSGALIRHFHDKCGTNSWGVEPDNSYRQYAQNQDLDVFASLEEWNDVLGLKADLITISHVLEHLSDPVNFLNNLRCNILDTSGYLLIEVPNLYFH